MHVGHLYEAPPQVLTIVLNTFKFTRFFIWYGRRFQIFGPKTVRFFPPKVTLEYNFAFIPRTSLRHFCFEYSTHKTWTWAACCFVNFNTHNLQP